MEKEIKDYLHLYLGCPCEFFIRLPAGFTAIGERTTLDVRVLHNVLNGLANCKPILRPLSDMSEEEKIELVRDITYNHVKFSSKQSALECFDDDNYTKKIHHMKFYADEMKYLLSKHFDLFGLIEAELAIDKTTLK